MLKLRQNVLVLVLRVRLTLLRDCGGLFGRAGQCLKCYTAISCMVGIFCNCDIPAWLRFDRMAQRPSLR